MPDGTPTTTTTTRPPTVSGADLLAAMQRWQPDAGCIAAGDRYMALAERCYAAAGLSNRQIDHRLRSFAGDLDGPYEAAECIARWAAPFAEPDQIAAWLGRLVDVAGWPEPAEIARIVDAAIQHGMEGAL